MHPALFAELVLPLHLGDAHAVGAIPALAPEPLRAQVVGVGLPVARVGGGAEVADADAEPVGAARALDAEIARLGRGQALHLAGHGLVAGLIVGGADRGEDDGDIGRRGRGEQHAIAVTRPRAPSIARRGPALTAT